VTIHVFKSWSRNPEQSHESLLSRRLDRRGRAGHGLHHFRLPSDEEEEKEKQKAGADEELDEEENEHYPVKKRLTRHPIGNDAEDRDRLEDRQEQVHDVRIVELVSVRQPAAGDEVAVDRGRGNEVTDRIKNGFT
jgi:hypothetical protein